MTYKKIDIKTWKRKEQFEFFNSFTEPFYGLVFDIDVTSIYQKAKQENESIFLLYLYHILKTVNNIEEFRMRIKNNEVLVYDKISCSPTIARDNGTFGFSYIDYDEDFDIFKSNAEKEIQRVKESNEFLPSKKRLDVIHFSSIPWIKFTSLSHARHYDIPDSVPKISCGKISEDNGRFTMPISIHVHHALVDGAHIGKFEKYLTNQISSIK